MLKNIILLIIVLSVFYGAYLLVNEFVSSAGKKADNSLSLPQIGVILKDTKDIQKKSEEKVQKYNDQMFDE